MLSDGRHHQPTCALRRKQPVNPIFGAGHLAQPRLMPFIFAVWIGVIAIAQ